ncbi:MAG: TonB-dependent receptor plug domain-containing protein [Bacteroidales bacterium]|nr:TonB-dependent receptor plug domain-containing protein [Bacteroidales bacterium]
MKRLDILLAGLAVWLSFPVFAQQQVDTLEAAVFTDRTQANYLSKGKDIRTEVVSSAGLMKMACCNLAESFENSSSVTVGYSDATTGARQIRLLGLSGIYTQMLDENRPVMRGLSAPFGLSFVPGSWLESIQIAKGSPSVINGVESMTGQINLEHKKPTDEIPLFVNASVMTDTKTDLNILSSLPLSDKVYTILMGHVDKTFKAEDMNEDDFADEPRLQQIDLATRWVYYTPELQGHWGVRGVKDRRQGGQMDGPWQSDVVNTSLNPYFKIGRSFREDNSASLALVGDYSFQKMEAGLGANRYDAVQHSAFANLIYRNQFTPSHDLTTGVNLTADWWDETVLARAQSLTGVRNRYLQWSPYAEYTFKDEERFSAIVGLTGVFLSGEGFRPAPRLTLRYQPFEKLVLRANGGRGVRRANPVVDNIGILSTGKLIEGDLTRRAVEDSWTFGGNATYYFTEHTWLSVDYFRTQFLSQLLLDRESADRIRFYDLDGHTSYSDNYQLDFSAEITEGLTFTLTGRVTDARAWQPYGEIREAALTSRYKGVFNAQYQTHLSRWIFDFTASVIGPSRVYDFMKDLKDASGDLLYPEGRTPAYPQLYAQITRRFPGLDVYIGGENLTNYTQPFPVIGAADPGSSTFDAASVWGPMMGIKVYAGIRLTLWR